MDYHNLDNCPFCPVLLSPAPPPPFNSFIFIFSLFCSGADAADFALSFASLTARGQLGPLGQQIPSMLREVELFSEPICMLLT